MAVRRSTRTSRLALPWERENSPFRKLFSGRKVLPLLIACLTLTVLWGAYWLGGKRADVRATRAAVHEAERAMRRFVADMGRCPQNAAELVHPPRSGVQYLNRAPSDAWGRALFLRCSAGEHTDIEVLSAGPGGSFLDDDNVM